MSGLPLMCFRPFATSVFAISYRGVRQGREQYLGRSEPGLTLTMYVHLMPGSRDLARKALRPQDHTG